MSIYSKVRVCEFIDIYDKPIDEIYRSISEFAYRHNVSLSDIVFDQEYNRDYDYYENVLVCYREPTEKELAQRRADKKKKAEKARKEAESAKVARQKQYEKLKKEFDV